MTLNFSLISPAKRIKEDSQSRYTQTGQSHLGRSHISTRWRAHYQRVISFNGERDMIEMPADGTPWAQEHTKQPPENILNMLEAATNLSHARAISFFNWDDLPLILRLLPRLIIVRFWLLAIGYPATCKKIEARLQPQNLSAAPTVPAMWFAMRATRILNELGRRMPVTSTCLARSLAIWWFLRKLGIAADLVMGVKKEDSFEAHACVEIFGVPVTDSRSAIAGFSAFDRSGL